MPKIPASHTINICILYLIFEGLYYYIDAASKRITVRSRGGYKHYIRVQVAIGNEKSNEEEDQYGDGLLQRTTKEKKQAQTINLKDENN